MDDDEGLAGEAESRGDSDGHHVAGVAHIVGCHPFPKEELAFGDDGLEVEDGEDILGGVFGYLFVDAPDEGGIEPLVAELDDDPLPHPNGVVVFEGDAIGVGAGQMQGKENIDKKSAAIHISEK